MDAMIDLETFSTAPNAAVAQVGLVLFERDGEGVVSSPGDTRAPNGVAVGLRWQWNVSVQSCLILGGRVDQPTVDWWRTQAPEAQASLTSTHALSIEQALRAMADLFGTWQPVCTWGHGSHFDISILDFYHHALGLTPPWPYSRVRDTRTVHELAQNLAGWEKPRRAVEHTAMADAEAQVHELQLALGALEGLRPGLALP